MKYERVPTEDPLGDIWNRLEVLMTVKGAAAFLEERGHFVSRDLIDRKARGMVFHLRSAEELFRQAPDAEMLSASICLYYGTFNLLAALLISDPKNEVTLAEIEQYTNQGGHGLKLITKPGLELMDNELIAVVGNGFLFHYLKQMSIPTDSLAVSKGYKSFKEVKPEEMDRLVSLREICARIPEIRVFYAEAFGRHPLVLHCEYNPNATIDYMRFPMDENTRFLSAECIRQLLGWPDTREIVPGKRGDRDYLQTKDSVAVSEMPSTPAYRSTLSPDAYVQPWKGISDVLLFYFMSLYALSIWSRYRPNLWREIVDGNHDELRPLIKNLLKYGKRIVPNLVLNRLYDCYFLFAGYAYYS
jgi:YaaC-like Protein